MSSLHPFRHRPRRAVDLEKTQMQETGKCDVRGLTLSEVIEIVNDLGIDPNEVGVSDAAIFVIGAA